MLRKMLLLVIASVLAACAPVTADRPLFAGDPVQPAEGLWVWAERDCRLPTSPDVRTWPQCAQSMRVEAGLVTWTRALTRPDGGLHASAPFAASDGDPLIVRLGGPEDGPCTTSWRSAPCRRTREAGSWRRTASSSPAGVIRFRASDRTLKAPAPPRP